MKFKPLAWKSEPEGIIAIPIGLKWYYSISTSEDKFTLTLIDDHGDWTHEICGPYESIEIAKNIAENHYLKILMALIEKK